MNAVGKVASIRSLGGELVTRILMLVIWCDVSGSMRGAKIESVNFAIDAVLALLGKRKRERRGIDLRVLVVTFGDQSEVVIPTTSIDQACFSNLVADGTDTRIGPAFDLVAKEYDRIKDEAGLSPVELIVTDGLIKDAWKPALQRLKATEYGSKARRLAVAIGSDADRDMLIEYLGGEGEPLSAEKPEEIAQAIFENVSESVSGVIQSHSRGGLNLISDSLPELSLIDNG